jgi:hypothetical protein
VSAGPVATAAPHRQLAGELAAFPEIPQERGDLVSGAAAAEWGLGEGTAFGSGRDLPPAKTEPDLSPTASALSVGEGPNPFPPQEESYR